MSEKFKSKLLIVFFAVFVGWLMISGVLDVVNKNDVKTVDIDSATTLLEVSHTISGIIPTGTDYYYVGLSEKDNAAYIIRGSKNWLKKNFKEDGTPQNGAAYSMSAMEKRINTFNVREEIQSRMSAVEGVDIPYGLNALDDRYKAVAVRKIILAIAYIGLGLSFIFVKNDAAPVVKNVRMVVLLVALFLSIGVLR